MLPRNKTFVITSLTAPRGRLAVFLLALLTMSIVAATAAQDELAQCEALVQRELAEGAGYFRLGYRLVRDAPGQFTLHLHYFSSSRWLASCRLTREGSRLIVHNWERAKVASMPGWLPGMPAR